LICSSLDASLVFLAVGRFSVFSGALVQERPSYRRAHLSIHVSETFATQPARPSASSWSRAAGTTHCLGRQARQAIAVLPPGLLLKCPSTTRIGICRHRA